MRSARRLIVAILGLAALDPFVPALLRRAEHRRYEQTQAFRFRSSDLFGLGPLISYLQEHPRGHRPRTMFLGNSVIYGFELRADEAVPARFQERHPEAQVFNAAINGFDLGSHYLVAATAIDAVDRFYVMRGTRVVHPMLASLIPVNDHLAIEFGVPQPNRLEANLQSLAARWQLYGSTYRLQAAMFGTSTREFLHGLTRPAHGRTFSTGDGAVQMTRPMSTAIPAAERQTALKQWDPLLWQFAGLVASRQKGVVFLQFGAPATDDAEIADFNATFAPYAEVVTLTVAPSLMFDGRHLTPIGARRVAEALP